MDVAGQKLYRKREVAKLEMLTVIQNPEVEVS